MSGFTITVNGRDRPAVEVRTEKAYHREPIDDEEASEYFVRVRWLLAVPRDQAIREAGFFGNQNTRGRTTSSVVAHDPCCALTVRAQPCGRAE